MVELFVLLSGVCMTLFMVFGNPLGRGAHASGQDDLDDAFVALKTKALTTDARADEQAYRQLLYRIDALLGRILERHLHVVLDAELRTPDVRRALGGAPAEAGSAGAFDLAALRHADLGPLPADVLLYLCFHLYLGGDVKDIGKVQSDPDLMLAILRHLVIERGYPPAKLLLGIVMKYGARADLPGDIGECGKLLREAQRAGVGSAALELHHLRKYAPLRGLTRLEAIPG